MEQIWHTNEKYFRLSLNTSWALVFCICTYVYSFKGIGINQEKEICLPNKEYISGHK